ncbi:MAG: alpha-amylase family glycosyl hydrolase [Pseudomonadota bacterium]
MLNHIKRGACAAAGLLLPVFCVAQDTAVTNAASYATDVIYQIVTDRFADGDPSNNPSGSLYDGSCANLKKYCGGDWQGIIDRLNDGYLTDMGITAIWISAPVENIYAVLNDTAGSTSYHGYWARDFMRTNPFYGELADFDALLAAAHANDVKVIIDFAPNHTSPADENNPSYAENGRLYDDGVLLGAYTNDTADFFHHNGGTSFATIEDGTYRNLFDLADFNHQNPVIDSYLEDAIEMWLDRGVDGIRVDAVKHMPIGWQKKWMAGIYDHKPVFTFGEWFLGEDEVDPENHKFANESGMSLLDFRFAQTVREVFRDRSDTMLDLDAMIQGTAGDYAEVIDQVTFIDNHDMDRFHTTGANARRLEQALAFAITSRGVPGIYYGSEQYLTGNGDPANRARMPGFDRTTTAYRVIQSLAPLRKSNPAVAYGDTQERWINGDVYVYEREFGNAVVLVAINRSEFSGVTLNGLFTALPVGGYADVLGGLLDGESISVAANGAVTPFNLGPGEVGVWSFVGGQSSPQVGHVGPMMGKGGQTVTIDGRGFGASTGQVFFGGAAATVVSWTETQIVTTAPSIAAGKYPVSVQRSNGAVSNAFSEFELLSGDQVSIRFIVNNAYTGWGQDVFLVGNVHELGGWNTDIAIGALYNQVITSYPTWYFDVSVPASTWLEFKFIKKNGASVVWENGSNHGFFTPAAGVGTVVVNWQN